MVYEKRFIDAEGNYEIWYCPEIGINKKINEMQDLYQAWLAEGNTPTEVEYTAAVVVVPSYAEQKGKLHEEATIYRTDRIDDCGWTEMRLKARDGGTKAAAIVAWGETLWADYYTRKTAINTETDSDYDFSNHGELPYEFKEAYEEVVG